MYTLSIPVEDDGRLDVAATSVGPSVSLTIVRHGVYTEAVRINDPDTARDLLLNLEKVIAYAGWKA